MAAAVQLLLVDAPPMPPGSPASRKCATCDRRARDGVYGPPTWALIGEAGAYERVWHADYWYCLAHGLELWDHWRSTVHLRAARRAQIAATLEARRAASTVPDT